MWKEQYEKQFQIGLNMAGIIGLWQGTATVCQYYDKAESDNMLKEVYEISRVWFKMREQGEFTVDQIRDIIAKEKAAAVDTTDIVELERA
jgi:hypothetical protein